MGWINEYAIQTEHHWEQLNTLFIEWNINFFKSSWSTLYIEQHEQLMAKSWVHVKTIKNVCFFLEAQILFLVDHVDKAVCGSRIN